MEVDLEEELSSSDSSSDDDADQNASESDVPQIPEDPFEVVGVSLNSNDSQSSMPQSSSNHESAEEFFDTVDEPLDETQSLDRK